MDIAFPYRTQRSFGASSFALVLVALIVEIELLVLLALGIVAHRLDLSASCARRGGSRMTE